MWVASTFLLILCNASKFVKSSDFIFHFVIDLKEMPIEYNKQLLPESKST